LLLTNQLRLAETAQKPINRNCFNARMLCGRHRISTDEILARLPPVATVIVCQSLIGRTTM
jgi:hypothetical protein